MKTALIYWAVILIASVIVEAATAQLVTIWFAVGAFAAIIANVLKAPIIVQWIVFVAFSGIALAVTRPLVKKFKSKQGSTATNADRYIGKKAIVVEDIDNLTSSGRVTVCGSNWSARSADGIKIAAGEEVTVEKIEGVKLIVTK